MFVVVERIRRVFWQNAHVTYTLRLGVRLGIEVRFEKPNKLLSFVGLDSRFGNFSQYVFIRFVAAPGDRSYLFYNNYYWDAFFSSAKTFRQTVKVSTHHSESFVQPFDRLKIVHRRGRFTCVCVDVRVVNFCSNNAPGLDNITRENLFDYNNNY